MASNIVTTYVFDEVKNDNFFLSRNLFNSRPKIVSKFPKLSQSCLKVIQKSSKDKTTSHQTENCAEEGQTFVQFAPEYYVLNEILLAMRFYHLVCMLV